MDSFVGDDISCVSLLVFPSVSSLAPIILIYMPNFFCVSVLFPSPLGSSCLSSMELSPKDVSSYNDYSSLSRITEVDNLQGLYPLKDGWIISCSLETRLVDQMKSSTTKVEMVKRLNGVNNQPEIWLKQSKCDGLKAVKAVEVLPW